MTAERRDSNRTNTDADTTQHDSSQQQQSSYGSTSPYHPQQHSSPATAIPTTTTMTMQVDTHQPGQAQLLGGQPLQAYELPALVPQQPAVSEGGTGSTTLAVTNLPYRIRWQDLKDLFRRYGTPSRADVFLAPDGRSRGVGMVSMRTRREAENCVNDLNGYEWYGRKIGVKIDETGGHHALAAAAMAGATIWEGVGFTQQTSAAAECYEALSPQMQSYPANVNTANPYLSIQPPAPNAVLFVGNLPFSTQWQDLKDLLRPAGRIIRADIAVAPDGRSKGWGTAVFATTQEAQHAIDTFDGWEVDGRIIKVRWDKFHGSTSQPSPQLGPTAGLSSPQMMHVQLSPAQTPRPNDYVAVPANPPPPPPQPNWQPQFMPAANLRAMGPSTAAINLPQNQPQPMQISAPVGQFHQGFVGSPYSPAPAGSPQNPPGQQGAYTGMIYNTSGWFPGYGAAHIAPQVRLPTAPVDTFAMMHQHQTLGGQSQNSGQRTDPTSSSNLYGM